MWFNKPKHPSETDQVQGLSKEKKSVRKPGELYLETALNNTIMSGSLGTKYKEMKGVKIFFKVLCVTVYITLQTLKLVEISPCFSFFPNK